VDRGTDEPQETRILKGLHKSSIGKNVGRMKTDFTHPNRNVMLFRHLLANGRFQEHPGLPFDQPGNQGSLILENHS